MLVNREEINGYDAVILAPTDELLSAEVVRVCEGLVDSCSAKNVIIDFRAIRWLVSSGLYPDAAPLTPLLRFHQQLKKRGCQVALCSLSSDIADVFRITRIDHIFEIHPNVDTAISSLSNRPKCAKENTGE